MRVAALLASSVAMFGASPAWACTLCHSRVAQDVRAMVFGPDFWSNLGALVSPLPVLLAGVFAVRGLLFREEWNGGDTHDD